VAEVSREAKHDEMCQSAGEGRNLKEGTICCITPDQVKRALRVIS
jgi:hypothetical protein